MQMTRTKPSPLPPRPLPEPRRIDRRHLGGNTRAMMSRRQEGLTLIETLIWISVVTSLLAVFVPTFFRNLRTSKVSEAAQQLETIHRHSAAYFEASHAPIDGGLPQRRCLPPTAGPTPELVGPDGQEVDFGAEGAPGTPTWTALGYQPETELRYRYTFLPSVAGCNLGATPEGGIALRLRAEGDMDGDGQLSRFERDARITEDGELVPTGVLSISNRVE